jgi:hypothetical protein
MLKLRNLFIILGMLLSPLAVADVGFSIGIGTPHVSIGINVPAYPDMVVVPGYPVYYAPRLSANLFFYDGMYWVYQNDYWYASSWYNGPWWVVSPEVVPVFILRVPVRYYRHPPAYFRGWRSDAPPRWGDHWGRNWEQRRGDWNRWDRRNAPAAAPPPEYQRHYSGERYPRRIEQQYELQNRNYRYEPREPAIKRHYEEQTMRRTHDQRSAPDRRDDDRSGNRSPEMRQNAPQSKPASSQDGRQQRQGERGDQGRANGDGQRQPDVYQRDQRAPGTQQDGERRPDRDTERQTTPGQDQRGGWDQRDGQDQRGGWDRYQ